MIAKTVEPRHHAALERIITLDLELICRSGLHIGAGKSQDLTGSDLPVIRDAAGLPYIPGSSLRGVLRAGIESLCRSLEWIGPPKEEEKKGGKEDKRSNLEKFKELWTGMDMVERLFGAAGGRGHYGSRLHFSDLMCKNRDVRIELRDGVAISRETRTASRGAKFDHEVVNAGAAFAGRIRLLNPLDEEVGLLAQSLWMLDEGVLLLGGKKARGLGWMEVRVSEATVRTAREILDCKRFHEKHELGKVEEKLGSYLSRLRETSVHKPEET